MLLAFALLAVLGSARMVPAQTAPPSDCVAHYDPNVDYFPHKATVRYAGAFSVEYHKNYKVVTVTRPWPNGHQKLRYALVRCGTPGPGGFLPSNVFTVPVHTVAPLSDSELAPIEALGLLDTVVGAGDSRDVHSPAFQARLRAGKILDIGHDTTNVNVEQAVNLSPDVIFAINSGPYANAYFKLSEAGLHVAIVAPFMESTPLGRAEWITYIALFYDREEQAQRLFDAMAHRYLALAALVRSARTRPTVVAGFSNRGTWYVPGGDGYFARFLNDAGGAYVYAALHADFDAPMNFEAVYPRAEMADYWVDQDLNWTTLGDVRRADSRYGDLRAVRDDHVFNNNARLMPFGAGNDYWQSGMTNPDRVLADLIEILHPMLLRHRQLYYYRKLGN
jgi:iron complex transport system substrate-binding protein